MENEKIENILFSDINKTIYDNCIFKCCDFSNINIDDSSFINTQFIECKFVGTNIENCLLKNTIFEHCKMDLIIIGSSNINNIKFTNCSLIEGTLYNNKLSKKSYIFNENDMKKININDSLKGISLANNDISLININIDNIKGAIISKEEAIVLVGLLGVSVDENS